jgi:hypothetical protein
VAFLARLQRPLPAAGLKRAMGRHNEKPYALITLKRSLRKLKALGLVGNSRNAPGATSCARTSRCGVGPPARARRMIPE